MICYLAINCLAPVHTRTATPNQALAQPSWPMSVLPQSTEHKRPQAES
jgi:S-methylmethionine-dependent homocysteine/selenocysteine methylase